MAEQTARAEAAKRYLARGWSILLLRPRDKRPLIPWTHLQIRRPSREDVAEWFRRWPDANIGVVSGEISNLIVLDVDPKHGGDAALERLERRYGPVPATVEATTGGGGYIVAPPSIHPSGAFYEWAPGRNPDEIALAPLSRWLIAPIQGLRVERSLSDWRHLVKEGVAEGQRNSTIASLTGHLLWHNVDPDVALELLLAWNRMRCRPPLDDTEAARVVASITKLHDFENAFEQERIGSDEFGLGPKAP
jgi:hypothetical protein